MAIFAGHFHDASAAVYGSNSTTADLAYTSCVAKKTWVAPPLALKNQERMLSKARGFLLVRVADGKVADVQAKWFEGPTLAAVNVSPIPNPSPSLQPWLVVLAFLGFIALVASLWWRFGRSDEENRDWKAFISVVACIILTLGIVWFARSQLGVTESAILIALVLSPLLVYGVASGRLTEFSGPGGWGAKFGQAAREPVELSSSEIDVTSLHGIAKEELSATEAKIRQIRTCKPVVMTMTLGSPGAPTDYDTYAVTQALKILLGSPNFRFVVFLESDGRLVSYMPGWMFLLRMESGLPNDPLLDAANSGRSEDVRRGDPGMLTETILPGTTNVKALDQMEELELDAIPVVERTSGKLKGIVERDRILSRMFLALAKGAKT